MRPEYDFVDAARGAHYRGYQAGTNVVFLDPDVAEVFRDSAAVNQALRQLVTLARAQVPATRGSGKIRQSRSPAQRKTKSPKRSGAVPR
jgi:hypothetical protein